MKKLLSILLIFSACNQKVLQPPESPYVDTLQISKRTLSDADVLAVSERMNLSLVRSITPAQVDLKIRDAVAPFSAQISTLTNSNKVLVSNDLFKDQKIADLINTQTLIMSASLSQQRKALADSVNNASAITALVLSNQTLQMQAAILKTYTDTLNARQTALQLNLSSASKYLDGNQFMLNGNTVKLNIPNIATQLKQ